MWRVVTVGLLVGLAGAACSDDASETSSATSGAGAGDTTSATDGSTTNTSTTDTSIATTTSATASSSSGGSSDACGHHGDAEPMTLVGITAAHNAKRCVRDTMGGDPIPPLAWDDTVAASAQAYADQHARGGCNQLNHSDAPYGENLYWTSGTGSPSAVIDAWVDGEESCFAYTSFPDCCSCTCGHLTQALWRGSTKLGCGFAECSTGGTIWVCQYDPPGNYIGQMPY